MPARFLLVLGLTNVFAFVCATASAQTPQPSHHVRIELAGVLARVKVERTLLPAQLRAGPGSATAIFDVALPDEALDVNFLLRPWSPKAPRRFKSSREARGHDQDAWLPLEERQAAEAPPHAAVKAQADPGARLRLFIEGARDAEAWELQYEYTVPLSCEQGAWTLTMPGAVDLAPLAAAVEVWMKPPAGVHVQGLSIAGRPTPSRTAKPFAVGEAPARAAWQVRLTVLEGGVGASVLSGVVQTGMGTPRHHTGLCRSRADAPATWPDAVVLAVDVSRSVGEAGLSLQRRYARAFLTALPAGTRWNAIFFDRRARALFPIFRLPTNESLAALDEALVPSVLQNGTEPVLALDLAAERLRQQQVEALEADAALKTAWLVMLTDGSVAERRLAAPEARLPSPAPWATAATVLLRPEGDQRPDAFARATYQRLLQTYGGIFRTADGAGLAEGAASDVADIARGGDWLAWPPLPGQAATAVPPGQGRVWVTSVPSRALKLTARGRDITVHPRRWRLRTTAKTSKALAMDPGAPREWVAPAGVRVGLWPLPRPTAEGASAGELDRSVLKNALALAFLPRARACYLNRSASSSAARDLRGRVRLVLEIERGEVLGASLAESTLEEAGIEACLEEAAYQVIIPRPVGRDAAVQAVLNLVFRPATTAEPAPATAFDKDLEILLSPLERTDAARDLELLDLPPR